MATQGTLTQTVSVAGMSLQGTTTRQSDSRLGYSSDPVLPAAKSGSLTTRTDADTGVLTLGSGHGIVTGDKVDVYWSGGLRYAMDVTADDETTITVDSGDGDDLPAEDTAVTVGKCVEVDFALTGDNVVMIGAGCTESRRAHVTFLSAADAILAAAEIPAGEVWSWASNTVTNPLASAS